MATKLLIVESPAKAKTIEKYLGSDFIVKSSYGHIRDLDKGDKGVDIENKFEPKYVITPEKQKVVKELKSASKKVKEVWLATDEDREGEAISWHLCEVLGLDEKTTKRIVFREITKEAIQKAVLAPRNVDLDLVDAQQARRILDRLVGFRLSETLWKKVKYGLSAGRVQSPAVKLIVERENDINTFTSEPFFRLNSFFDVLNKQGRKVELKSELTNRLDDIKDARSFLDKSNGAEFKINEIKIKPLKRNPAAPFTTSTLQQEASRKIGFSVNRTMSTAQRLYEQGFITYMRTDSKNLSTMALGTIADEIKSAFGDNYHHLRTYKSKSAGAQEAHEAIRPTYIANHSVEGTDDMRKLYDLIWKRTIASQMASAQLEKTTVVVGVSTIPDAKLQAVGEVLKFDGFLKVYIESKDEDSDEEAAGILPPLSEGQILDLNRMEAVQRFTRPPARYTEASLVKKLEELGIGRPSTYAPTVTKIMEKTRGYVTKESREGVERSFDFLMLQGGKVVEEKNKEVTGATSNRLYASDIGKVIVKFLSQHFDEIMNYDFTAGIENKLDKVAEGKVDWKKMLQEFYVPFKKDVDDTIENADREKGTRILGTHPESGLSILAQMSRFGPVVQIGSREEVEKLGEDAKPQFSGLKVGQSIESITLEEAMELFKLPLTLGHYLEKEIVIASGRFGPYIKFDEKFISLPKGQDPTTVTMEQAQELIDEKIKSDAPIGTFEELPITKGKGRFGPYLKWNDFFINIPRRYDADNITVAEMNELIEAKKIKEANRFVKRWPEEGIDIENGRWGPFIRFKKKSYKIPKKEDGQRMTSEEALELDLEQIKTWMEEQGGKPKRPKKATVKKTTAKKTTAKKATAKKTTAKKPAAKKVAAKKVKAKKKD